MSVEALVNLVHREVVRVLDGRTRETAGIVDSYDPVTHSVKMKLQPEDILTGWMPLRQAQAGNGVGSHMAPSIGDHMSAAFHEDEREAGTVSGAFFNDISKPVSVEAGEWRYISPNGKAEFYFKKDGSFEVKDKSGASYKADGNGVVTVTDKGGNKITLDGSSTITLHAATIVLDGTVKLGGADASLEVSARGTTDSSGDAETGNFLTKVFGK